MEEKRAYDGDKHASFPELYKMHVLQIVDNLGQAPIWSVVFLNVIYSDYLTLSGCRLQRK